MARRLDTALFRETRNASGSADRARELIAAGAAVNRRHKFGTTPLWQAACHGRLDLVAALLAAGADPGVYDDEGAGSLYWAASKGHAAMVERLLAAGADPNALRGIRTSFGQCGHSPLAAAIYHGHAAAVSILIEAGAATDHQYFGRTMAGYADSCGQPEIAAMLRRRRGRA